MRIIRTVQLYVTLAIGLMIAGYAVSVLVRFSDKNTVVIYVSHDQDYAQPVLEAFEKASGIAVNAVYDTEASKTVGLTNRLIAEKQNPQADVFWNNEVVRTIQLKKEDVLEAYIPDSARDIDARYKDPDGYWTGFAARARVLIVHTGLLPQNDHPSSLNDLTHEAYKGMLTIADPRFGTTGSHLAALYTVWGQEKTIDYFRSLRNQNIDVAQSNGQTRDKVVAGEKRIGFTDTDDVHDALLENKPVAMIYPDQGPQDIGTLIIPNTAMLIKGAKHPQQAKLLLQFLISKETESRLAYAKSAQMPLLPGVDKPASTGDVTGIKAMDIRWEDVYENLTPTMKLAEEYLLYQ